MPDFDPHVAGRAHRATDVLHSLIYFVPEAEEELVAVGVRPGRMCYFASRSAPMGTVPASLTTATFYNFNPDLVAKYIPRAWTLASPEQMIAARFRAADRALRRLLGDDAVASAEMAEFAELARAATTALELYGRPLYGAHADIEWPVEPHLVMWHAVTLLREYRGDGHIAALLRAGLSGIESIITHTATGRGFNEASAKLLRGWSDAQWDMAAAGLVTRGVMDAAGLTADGFALRERLEDATDEMDMAAWRHLGHDHTERVIELGKQFSRAAVANGALPAGVFASA